MSLGKLTDSEVRGGGEGGGKDLLGGDLEPQAEELLEVARAGLGGVVGDEDEPLAQLAEHGDGLGDALDEGVALPDDAVAVEDERLDGINQALLVAVLELVHLGLDRHGADGAGRLAAGGTQGSASESGLGGDARATDAAAAELSAKDIKTLVCWSGETRRMCRAGTCVCRARGRMSRRKLLAVEN